MLYEVMNEINNHFVKSVERKDFQIEADGVVGTFTETYLAGMYIIIEGSYKNDGIYEIATVSSTKITTVETLEVEDEEDDFLLYASSPPKSFLNLVTEIESYSESTGIKSESLGDYQVEFANGGGEWQKVYSNKLQSYRRVFDDLREFAEYSPNCTDRWC